MVDGGESAKSLGRPGLQRLLTLINAGRVHAVIVAKLDRLSVKDLCRLQELFEKREVALISVGNRWTSDRRRDVWSSGSGEQLVSGSARRSGSGCVMPCSTKIAIEIRVG
jgi:hypothetical protein